MESRSRDVVPRKREVRPGIRLFVDELLRGREVALHERHQRARRDPEPQMARLPKVHDETMHLVRLSPGGRHVGQLRVAEPQHHLGVDQAFAVAKGGRKIGHLTSELEADFRVLGPPDRPEATGERVRTAPPDRRSFARKLDCLAAERIGLGAPLGGASKGAGEAGQQSNAQGVIGPTQVDERILEQRDELRLATRAATRAAARRGRARPVRAPARRPVPSRARTPRSGRRVRRESRRPGSARRRAPAGSRVEPSGRWLAERSSAARAIRYRRAASSNASDRDASTPARRAYSTAF